MTVSVFSMMANAILHGSKRVQVLKSVLNMDALNNIFVIKLMLMAILYSAVTRAYAMKVSEKKQLFLVFGLYSRNAIIYLRFHYFLIFLYNTELIYKYSRLLLFQICKGKAKQIVQERTSSRRTRVRDNQWYIIANSIQEKWVFIRSR